MNSISKKYQQCKNCLLDTIDDPEIVFNEEGVCSYCSLYKVEAEKLPRTETEAKSLLNKCVSEIKKTGQNKRFDCILGISGGVDSTYLALKAKELGLRPLAVHFDNGWNSELAVKNIENIVSKLNLELYTIVVDWEEFKDLQLAFIKASVIDIELATDHAIMATMYKLALQHDIKYILSGHNIATELILPKNWYHDKLDHVHIRSISAKLGNVPLKTYPLLDSMTKFKMSLRNIKTVQLLNYLPYNKAEVKKIIQNKLNWRDYGGKHYESIFTRFYQGYILVNKFGVDKRKAHLSNLICSGQITRAEALQELNRPAYDAVQLQEDYQFVLKKFDLTKEEFESFMKAPIYRHSDYEIDRSIYDRFFLLRLLSPFWKLFKRLRS